MNYGLAEHIEEPAAIGTIDSTELEGLEAEATDALECLVKWVEEEGSLYEAQRFGRIFAIALRNKRLRMVEP